MGPSLFSTLSMNEGFPHGLRGQRKEGLSILSDPVDPSPTAHSVVMNGVNQYFIAQADGTNIGAGGIAFWFKPTDHLTATAQWANTLSSGNPFILCRFGTSLVWYIKGDFRLGGGAVTLDTWNFAAFTFINDDSGHVTQIRSYLNGFLVDQNLTLTGEIPVNDPEAANATHLYLGNGFGGYTVGKFAAATVFGGEITTPDIAALFAAGVTANPVDNFDSIIGWWPFTEADGTNVAVQSNFGSSSDGTLVNGPTWDTDVP